MKEMLYKHRNFFQCNISLIFPKSIYDWLTKHNYGDINFQIASYYGIGMDRIRWFANQRIWWDASWIDCLQYPAGSGLYHPRSGLKTGEESDKISEWRQIWLGKN